MITQIFLTEDHVPDGVGPRDMSIHTGRKLVKYANQRVERQGRNFEEVRLGRVSTYTFTMTKLIHQVTE
jgi:hypothetical protein